MLTDEEIESPYEDITHYEALRDAVKELGISEVLLHLSTIVIELEFDE